MIETKEHYDEYNISGDMDYSRNDWAVLWANDIRPTIEALREVARVAENALTYENERGIWTLSDDDAQDMQEAYARIPDWITDDPKEK